ncbi:MAG: FmdB family zinc ribbon protein [Candidatus Zixiibacteriota bacterium]
MPIYEYKCTKCGHISECICKASTVNEKKCEKCGETAKRLFPTKVGLVFKGDGFYITDYKDKKSSLATDEEKKPKPKDDKPVKADESTPKDSKAGAGE